jgi:predicted DNA-binding protein with PD1-like motif
MKSQFLYGSLWTARKIENTYIISIKDGASIVNTLKDFVLRQKIKTGKISGVGIVEKVLLRFLSPSGKKYINGKFNAISDASDISGNISENDGKSMLHLHIMLRINEHTVLDGFLMDGKVRGKAEFILHSLENQLVISKSEKTPPNICHLNSLN